MPGDFLLESARVAPEGWIVPASLTFFFEDDLRGTVNALGGNVVLPEELAEHTGQPDSSGSWAAVVVLLRARFPVQFC